MLLIISGRGGRAFPRSQHLWRGSLREEMRGVQIERRTRTINPVPLNSGTNTAVCNRWLSLTRSSQTSLQILRHALASEGKLRLNWPRGQNSSTRCCFRSANRNLEHYLCKKTRLSPPTNILHDQLFSDYSTLAQMSRCAPRILRV